MATVASTVMTIGLDYLSSAQPWNNETSNFSLTIGSNSTSEPFPRYMSLFMTLACGFIFIVGLIGNCLVPVVIWNNRDLRNSTNLFLLNLSLADILILCVSMPTVLVEIHSEPEVWILGKFMCEFFFFNLKSNY